jgi:elongation factor 1-beta
VKPWDDETDMKALEDSVRSLSQDGLVWGSSTLIPVGFGIKKLQITLVVEDDKVSLEELQEQIEEFEDFVQSTDIVPCPNQSSKVNSRPPWPSCKLFTLQNGLLVAY